MDQHHASKRGIEHLGAGWIQQFEAQPVRKAVAKLNCSQVWQERGMPVSEPAGGSTAAAALMVSVSGTADFASSELGSESFTCCSKLS